jgi:SAM-dependent methyltransferase
MIKSKVEPRWESCVVAASGPSLTPEVVEACKGQNVLTVSNAYELFPNANVFYSGDARWFEIHSKLADLQGEIWSTYDPSRKAEENKENVAERYGINLIGVRYDEAFSLDPSYVNSGNNSGFAGLNLAILMGAKRIVLVGFDMRHVDGKKHFFGDHPSPLRNSPPKVFPAWIEIFTKAAKTLPADIKVVNATPDSALQCFPAWGLEAALAWASPETVAAKRLSEHAKYKRAYQKQGYKMGDRRRPVAVSDLATLPVRESYLDVACGRGEMLREAETLGYTKVKGTEIVPDLIDGERVIYGEVHELPFPDKSFDTVTMFDVIEHLLPGDDELACRELARVARSHVLVAAAKNVSIKPNGDVLHINLRSYEEWDRLFRKWFPGQVTWIKDDQVRPSQTWRIDVNVKIIKRKDKNPMKFRYVGECPAGQSSVKCFGLAFVPGEAVELPEQIAEKARRNRFFEAVEEEIIVPVDGKVDPEWDYNPLVDMDREDLITLAEEKGVKIDKRWNAEKIAAAIKDAANGE